MENPTFPIFRLMHSSPNNVFSWLKENKPEINRSLFHPDREELENALIDKDNPLINLGLALYGFEESTGLKLFQNKNKTIKKAVLSGTTIGAGLSENWFEKSGELNKLLNNFDEELLGCYISNEYINSNYLERLYERKNPFNNLDDEKWYILLYASTLNSRISTPYDNTWMDGFSEFLYHRVFDTAWRLFKILPVNKESATLLCHLGEKLVPSTTNMNLFEVIKRWRVEDVNQDEIDFEQCRYYFTKLIRDFGDDFKALKDSEDIALRRSYYCRYTAYEPENVRELFEKDNEIFLDEALNNENLYRMEKIRNELGKCCWDYKDPNHDLLYPNIFNSRVEHFTNKHPEWFKDCDGEIPLHKIDDQQRRIELQLNITSNMVKEIHERLFGNNNNIYQFQVDDLREIISQSAINISHKRTANILSYLWIFIGFLIGYFIEKLL